MREKSGSYTYTSYTEGFVCLFEGGGGGWAVFCFIT